MRPGRLRQVVEVVLGLGWIGILVLLAVTQHETGSPVSRHPVLQIILAVLISGLGGLLLAHRAYYVSVYSRGINRGPFKMGESAIVRLVVVTGVFLVVLGIVIGQFAFRRLIILYGF